MLTAVLAAFAVVFLAELGDKTQLAAVGFGARYRPLPVVTGLTIAFAATSLLSVVVGNLIGDAFPTDAVAIVGGVLFLAFALVTWRGRGDIEEGDAPTSSGRSVVVTVAVGIFVAELGDKTMLSTATLATQEAPVAVWVGATLGLVSAGIAGMAIGYRVGQRFDARVVRTVSAALFAAFGIALIASGVW